MEWLWIGLGIAVLIVGTLLTVQHFRFMRKYVPIIVRIFEEKPPFVLPFGQPVPGAEEITLTTPDGLALQGCYMHTPKPRKGVILFGLEFGSNRWACVPYCEFLIDAGYDIFAFEMRGQGNSPPQPGYAPLQWVTEFEVLDFQTALAYLKNRADGDPRGVGFFGLSKGGTAGLMAAAQDQFIRCCVVDGVFAVMGTVLPFMRQWVFIYTRVPWLARVLPDAYYLIFLRSALRRLEAMHGCRYPALESFLPLLAPRPLLMIHGGADTYIKPDMARSLFECARQPKELWLVENAKHNQSIILAAEEYKKRVLAFFEKHLDRPNDAVATDTVVAEPAPTTAPK